MHSADDRALAQARNEPRDAAQTSAGSWPKRLPSDGSAERLVVEVPGFDPVVETGWLVAIGPLADREEG
jgi:hypothetical protein